MKERARDQLVGGVDCYCKMNKTFCFIKKNRFFLRKKRF